MENTDPPNESSAPAAESSPPSSGTVAVACGCFGRRKNNRKLVNAKARAKNIQRKRFVSAFFWRSRYFDAQSGKNPDDYNFEEYGDDDWDQDSLFFFDAEQEPLRDGEYPVVQEPETLLRQPPPAARAVSFAPAAATTLPDPDRTPVKSSRRRWLPAPPLATLPRKRPEIGVFSPTPESPSDPVDLLVERQGQDDGPGDGSQAQDDRDPGQTPREGIAHQGGRYQPEDRFRHAGDLAGQSGDRGRRSRQIFSPRNSNRGGGELRRLLECNGRLVKRIGREAVFQFVCGFSEWRRKGRGWMILQHQAQDQQRSETEQIAARQLLGVLPNRFCFRFRHLFRARIGLSLVDQHYRKTTGWKLHHGGGAFPGIDSREELHHNRSTTASASFSSFRSVAAGLRCAIPGRT